jgi:hypothetical protein
MAHAFPLSSQDGLYDCVAQSIKFNLPWKVFQALGKDEKCGPNSCFVFASQ